VEINIQIGRTSIVIASLDGGEKAALVNEIYLSNFPSFKCKNMIRGIHGTYFELELEGYEGGVFSRDYKSVDGSVRVLVTEDILKKEKKVECKVQVYDVPLTGYERYNYFDEMFLVCVFKRSFHNLSRECAFLSDELCIEFLNDCEDFKMLVDAANICGISGIEKDLFSILSNQKSKRVKEREWVD